MAVGRLKGGIGMQRVNILGVAVSDISENSAIEAILAMSRDRNKGHQVVTCNPEFVMLARRNADFAKILSAADLVVADGKGVVLAKLLLGGKEQMRITGVDLVEKLCEESAKSAIAVGFLGGFGRVAEVVAKRQRGKNPKLLVTLAEPGDPAIGYDLRLRRLINAKKRIDILFVAYGMGQQEFWIERNRKFVNVGVFIGVGGAFDVLSTVKRRAPRFFARWGLEWLWRLFWEPARIWRMRVLPVFAILVFGQWFLRKFQKVASFK